MPPPPPPFGSVSTESLDLSTTSYSELFLEVERQDVAGSLSRCARIVNGLAVNAYAVCVQRQFRQSVDGLIKSRIFGYLAGEVGTKDATGGMQAETAVARAERRAQAVGRERDQLEEELEDIRAQASVRAVSRGEEHFCELPVFDDESLTAVVEITDVFIPVDQFYGLKLRYRGRSMALKPENVARVRITHRQTLDEVWIWADLHFLPGGIFEVLRTSALFQPGAGRSGGKLLSRCGGTGEYVCDFAEFCGRWLMDTADAEVELAEVTLKNPDPVADSDSD